MTPHRVVFVLAALVLAGCGDAAGKADRPPPTPSATTAEPTATRQAGSPSASALTTTIRREFQTAGTDGNYDPAAGTFTDAGRVHLRAAANAWERYLKIAARPDARLARVMVQIYGPTALAELPKAISAQQIVVADTAGKGRAARSSAFAQLAVLAYAAGQKNTGGLASQRALELTPADRRPVLRQQLQEIARTRRVPPVGP